MKEEVVSLRHENEALRQKLDDLEQYDRRPLVRFSGLPEQGKDENTNPLLTEVIRKAKP